MNTVLYFRRIIAYKFVITINIIYISTQYVPETYFKDIFSAFSVRRRFVFGLSSVRLRKSLVCLPYECDIGTTSLCLR